MPETPVMVVARPPRNGPTLRHWRPASDPTSRVGVTAVTVTAGRGRWAATGTGLTSTATMATRGPSRRDDDFDMDPGFLREYDRVWSPTTLYGSADGG